MPNFEIYVEPSIAVEWRGITIHNTYSDDDYSQGEDWYHFTTSCDDRDDTYHFDIRELCVDAVRLLEELRPPFNPIKGLKLMNEDEVKQLDLKWEMYHDMIKPLVVKLILMQAINDELLVLPDHIEYKRFESYPEADNKQRAMVGGLVLQLYMCLTGSDPDTALRDTLGDLMHWADSSVFNFDHELRAGTNHYGVELDEEKGDE